LPADLCSRPPLTYSITNLGTLGDGESAAVDINQSGQVVGESSTVVSKGNVLHAFLWQADSGMQDLGTLGGDYSTATGINDGGQVAGHSTNAFNIAPHASLWQSESGMGSLGTLEGP
jgi:probable HAF family extracellular repeat protein